MSEQIQLRELVEKKIARAAASGEPCPFPCDSWAAEAFHRLRAAQPHHAPANPGRVDLAQGAA